MCGCPFGAMLLILISQHLSVHTSTDSSLVADSSMNAASNTDAYIQGRMEAQLEIRAEDCTIYLYGLKEIGEDLDRETGLPYKMIWACSPPKSVIDRAAGHNDAINEHIKKHGVPRCSFRRWDKELFDLEAYFRLRSQTEKPLKLTNLFLISKDHDCAIRLIYGDRIHSNMKEDWVLLFGPADEKSHASALAIVRGSELPEILWGPSGSFYAIIKYKTFGGIKYAAIDLKRKRWLRSQMASQRVKKGNGPGRPGGLPPRAPTDPDVRVK